MTRKVFEGQKFSPLIQNDSPSRWAQTVQSFSLWLPDCAMPLPWLISTSAVAVLLLTAQRSGVLGTAQLRTQCLVWSANSPHPSQLTLQTSQACTIQGFCTKPLVKLLLLKKPTSLTTSRCLRGRQIRVWHRQCQGHGFHPVWAIHPAAGLGDPWGLLPNQDTLWAL